MQKLYLLALSFFLLFTVVYPQEMFTGQNLQGKEALKLNNYDAAEKLFYQSIMQNKDADSYFQLGAIYKKKNDSHLKELGYGYSLKATQLVPESIEYKCLYLDYLVDFGSAGKREDGYREILKSNPQNIKAILRMAEIFSDKYNKRKEFLVNSMLWAMDEAVDPVDMTEEAKPYLDSAEVLFQKGLKLDSLNYDLLFGIARLYQSSYNQDMSLKYFNIIEKFYPNSKDIHLELGIILYKKKKYIEALNELEKAIDLMEVEEKEDFVYNSVIDILEPKFSEVLRKMGVEGKRAFIEKWWKLSDPFYLTEYNERLMEHYIRVAYSNLHFSVPNISLKGWKSDRGQVFLRYGEPIRQMIVKQRNSLLFDKYMEMWEYNNLPGFCFSGENNYLKFVGGNISTFREYAQGPGDGLEKFKITTMPGSSRFSLNSFKDYEILKFQRNQSYKPRLYGSNINLDLRTYSFNKLSGSDDGNLETYVVYSIPVMDTTYKNYVKDYSHEYGIFFFDQNFEPIIQTRKSVSGLEIKNAFNDGKEIQPNCIGIGIRPGKTSLAFDLKRLIDTCYYTYRKVVEIPFYEHSMLGMSDLVLTKQVSIDKELPFAIKRNGMSFYPNLKNSFKNGDQFFIYYELYNLQMDEMKKGDFEQVITIKPQGEKGFNLKKIIKGITTLFSGEEGKVSLTTNYKVLEENTQIYVQLDLTGYKPGKYDLVIQVNDKVSDKSVEKKVDLEIL